MGCCGQQRKRFLSSVALKKSLENKKSEPEKSEENKPLSRREIRNIRKARIERRNQRIERRQARTLEQKQKNDSRPFQNNQ
jgi:hypothetical protein